MMRYKIIAISIFLTSCIGQENKFGAPHSRFYEPIVPGEREILEKADKSILPFDLELDPAGNLDKSVVWTGIVEDIVVRETENETILVDIYLQHRYYDFVEDFSVQTEKMFVSPEGEGKYIFRAEVKQAIPLDEFKKQLPRMFYPECFLITYGKIKGFEDSLPVLHQESMRIVFPENYATNIMTYRVERDKYNKVVLDEDGAPKLIESRFLKIATPGRNQIGSRLKNSKT